MLQQYASDDEELDELAEDVDDEFLSLQNSVTTSTPASPPQAATPTNNGVLGKRKTAVPKSMMEYAMQNLKKTKLGTEQVAVLQAHYNLDDRPSNITIESIASQLQVDKEKVKSWFANQRLKVRKEGGTVSSSSPRPSAKKRRPSLTAPAIASRLPSALATAAGDPSGPVDARGSDQSNDAPSSTSSSVPQIPSGATLPRGQAKRSGGPRRHTVEVSDLTHVHVINLSDLPPLGAANVMELHSSIYYRPELAESLVGASGPSTSSSSSVEDMTGVDGEDMSPPMLGSNANMSDVHALLQMSLPRLAQESIPRNQPLPTPVLPLPTTVPVNHPQAPPSSQKQLVASASSAIPLPQSGMPNPLSHTSAVQTQIMPAPPPPISNASRSSSSSSSSLSSRSGSGSSIASDGEATDNEGDRDGEGQADEEEGEEEEEEEDDGNDTLDKELDDDEEVEYEEDENSGDIEYAERGLLSQMQQESDFQRFSPLLIDIEQLSQD
ncbi:hypothetical protein HDU97_002233 [Phlyctochytrium planicorne]|nr:hypothetical protein HDU97_002233 [Phlyctochytrium planicorne]